jgi:hypothetical protein
MVRTASGTLHLVYPTAAQTSGVDGIAARSISSSGIVGAQVQALSGWRPSLPGLVELPNGMLEAMFGAVAPALPNASTIWGITSSDGGATWTPPADVRSGPTSSWPMHRT